MSKETDLYTRIRWTYEEFTALYPCEEKTLSLFSDFQEGIPNVGECYFGATRTMKHKVLKVEKATMWVYTKHEREGSKCTRVHRLPRTHRRLMYLINNVSNE